MIEIVLFGRLARYFADVFSHFEFSLLTGREAEISPFRA